MLTIASWMGIDNINSQQSLTFSKSRFHIPCLQFFRQGLENFGVAPQENPHCASRKTFFQPQTTGETANFDRFARRRYCKDNTSKRKMQTECCNS